MSTIEERVAKIEGIVEQMGQRVNHIETRLERIEAKIDGYFRWTVGLTIAMWITVMLAILFK